MTKYPHFGAVNTLGSCQGVVTTYTVQQYCYIRGYLSKLVFLLHPCLPSPPLPNPCIHEGHSTPSYQIFLTVQAVTTKNELQQSPTTAFMN